MNSRAKRVGKLAKDHEPKIIQAAELGKKNGLKGEELQGEFARQSKRAQRLESQHAEDIHDAFDSVLAPFAESFARLKNVDLESPDLLNRLPALEKLDAQARKVSLGTLKGLVTVAGGIGLGAGAGALTFAAVGTFAAASTGTAISALSGAAATSATLAWLGGGSLAAGGMGMAGGTMVLAGIVALPAVLGAGVFLSWQGRRELAKQQQAAAELAQAQHELQHTTQRLDIVETLARDAGHTLQRLVDRARPLNAWLANQLALNDDYLSFTEDDRDRLALLVGIATAISAVMSCPLLDDQGAPNVAHTAIMRQARESVS